jgi:uronate dehydrogenase
MRILVTGAAGTIGSVVCPGLSEKGHEVRGLDIRRAAGFPGEFVVGDCSEAEVADAAVAGVDAVVHLAGNPAETSLPQCLDSHVVTTARLLDAMVTHGVGRMAYASSNHAVGRTPRREMLATDTRARPDTFYGVAKVAAEAVLSLYVDRHRIGAVAMRIGSFGHEPRGRRSLSTWLSPADCVRLVDAAIHIPRGDFAIVYGVSANTRRWWDLDAGRAIGYQPEDDAEAWAAGIEAGPETDEERAEEQFVGGPFATPRYARAAFDPPDG